MNVRLRQKHDAELGALVARFVLDLEDLVVRIARAEVHRQIESIRTLRDAASPRHFDPAHHRGGRTEADLFRAVASTCNSPGGAA